MIPKQQEILKHLSNIKHATISELYEVVKWDSYNEGMHLTDALKEMVKSGHVVRLKKGLFALKVEQDTTEQSKLF